MITDSNPKKCFLIGNLLHIGVKHPCCEFLTVAGFSQVLSPALRASDSALFSILPDLILFEKSPPFINFESAVNGSYSDKDVFPGLDPVSLRCQKESIIFS